MSGSAHSREDVPFVPINGVMGLERVRERLGRDTLRARVAVILSIEIRGVVLILVVFPIV